MQDEMEDHAYQDYQHLKAKKMKYEPKPDVIALTHKSKYLYPLFNRFELEANRFHSLPEFARLEAEVLAFNEELEAWKHHDREVKNIFLTYNLYQNLFSRIKYTSSLVLDREEAQRAYADIAKWFLQQKPRVRNKAPEREQGQMKPSTATKETETEIDSLLLSNATKRELKAYESMARTTHTQFFPPKERLQEYKRRDLLEGLTQHTQRRDLLEGLTQQTQRRALSVSNLNKGGVTRSKQSFATTRTTFFKTATQLTKQESAPQAPPEPVVPPFLVEGEKEGEDFPLPDEDLLEQMNKEKQVQQEEILQQNIVQIVNEEDQPDGDEEPCSEQEEKDDRKYRKYRVDPSASDQMAAEQNIKDVKQSTLKRILKEKEEAVRCKIEELSMAQQMSNWGAVKSRQASEEHCKLERKLLVNKYTKLEYVPKTLQEKQRARKRDIPEFEVFYRSKSSCPGTIEQEVQRLKINSALKTYGKYINHVNIVPVQAESQEEKDQMRVMRSTSLTSFCRQGKKTPFSQTVAKFGVSSHNEDALEILHKIKERLAKTSIPVEKKEILRAMGVADCLRMDLPDSKLIYPPQKQLLNNPFFPKHLFQTKSKKKKK